MLGQLVGTLFDGDAAAAWTAARDGAAPGARAGGGVRGLLFARGRGEAAAPAAAPLLEVIAAFVLLREAARERDARRAPAELAKLLHALLTDDAFAVRVRAEARDADAAAAFRAACARLALCDGDDAAGVAAMAGGADAFAAGAAPLIAAAQI